MLSSVCNLECLRWFPLSSHPWCSSWGMWCCSLGLLGLCSINQSASQICGTKNPNIFSFLSFSIKCMGEYWKHYLKPLIQTLSYRAAKLRPFRKNGHTNNLFFQNILLNLHNSYWFLNNSHWPLEDSFFWQGLSFCMYNNIWAILHIIPSTVLEWGCTTCMKLLNEILLPTTLTDTFSSNHSLKVPVFCTEITL